METRIHTHLDVRDLKVLRGPSLWAPVPVVQLLLDLDLGDPEARPDDAGVVRCLEGLLAAVATRVGAPPPAPLPAGSEPSTSALPSAVARAALALQTLAGDDPAPTVAEAIDGGGPNLWRVHVGYHLEEIGVAAARFAVRLAAHAAGAEPIHDLDPAAAFGHDVLRVAERVGFGPSTRAIVRAARARSIPTVRPDAAGGFVVLGQGARQRRIWATATDGTSLVAAYVARDKALCARLLEEAGVPVPAWRVVDDAEGAARAAARIGFPVVVKPVDGNHGRGVTLGVADEEGARAAFAAAAARSGDGRALVQAQVPGRDVRLLVVGGRLVAAAERSPAHVVGDGARSVRALVEAVNADPRRGPGHARPLTLLPDGAAATAVLVDQGFGWEDAPAAGQVVRLAAVANLSAGGTAIDRTDEVHPDNARIAVEAAALAGLDVAGIDVMTADIARPMAADGGAVVEVNAAPGLRMHLHPSEGQPRPAGGAIVDLLFPSERPARIPIVAVTGTNGKTTTTRMAACILAAHGYVVGLTTTDGMEVGGRVVATGDLAGPGSARAVLRHPLVEAAALETARGGILREGLGFDGCDVGIVTNVAADHLGLGGIETLDDLARVKAVVPRAVFPHGSSVLNADDPRTAAMADVAGGEVVFFSADRSNPVVQAHLAAGGRAALLDETPDGDCLRLLAGGGEIDLLPAAAIPATFGGALRVNALNALAAAAAGWALGIPVATIREALAGFAAGFGTTPGRFNLLEVEGRRVIVDYAHNVAALEAVGEFVRRLAPPRSVAMLAIPGDRSDEDSLALGRLAGRLFDAVVIREAANTRGRPRGDSANLLRRGVLEAGMPEHEVRIVLDEVEAAHATVDFARSGDLALIFVTRPRVIWEELSARAGRTTDGAGDAGAVEG